MGMKLSEKFEDSLDDLIISNRTCENRKIQAADYLVKFDLTPINAWSSYAYIFAGNFLISKSLGEGGDPTNGSNLFTTNPVFLFLWGMVLNLVGTSSFVYHASATRFGYFMDFGNIMGMTTFWLFYSIVDLNEEALGDFPMNFIAVGGWLLSFAVSYVVRSIGEIAIYVLCPIMVVVTLWAIRQKRMMDTNWTYLYACAALFAVAFVFFEGNVDWPWCHPESSFQFHSIWHVLSAAAIFSMILFHYSEHGVEWHF